MRAPSKEGLAAAEEITAAIEGFIKKVTQMQSPFVDPERRPRVVVTLANLMDQHYGKGGEDNGQTDDQDVPAG